MPKIPQALPQKAGLGTVMNEQSIGIILGVIIGIILRTQGGFGLSRRIVDTVGHDKYVLYKATNGFLLTWGDVIYIALGFVIFAVGRRIHVVVKWIGFGIIVYYIGAEINEAVYGSSGSFD